MRRLLPPPRGMRARRVRGPRASFGYVAAVLLCLGLQVETTAAKGWIEDTDMYDLPFELQRAPQYPHPRATALPSTKAYPAKNSNSQKFSKVPLSEDPQEWPPSPVITTSRKSTIVPNNLAKNNTLTKSKAAKKKSMELEAELLAAMHEPLTQSLDYGEKIHEYLVKLWPPILKKGLTRELQEKLSQKYLIPSNCKLLEAPKLNEEISCLVPAYVRQMDRALTAQQQQLGRALTAVSRAIHLLLGGGDKKKIIQHLSNGCRILSDLHSIYTQNRINLIMPLLQDNVLQIIRGSERDETLFGKKVSLKLRVLQGKNIKKAIMFRDEQSYNPALFSFYVPEEQEIIKPPTYAANTTVSTSTTTMTTTTTAATTPLYDAGKARLKSPFDYYYFINKYSKKNND